MSIEPTHGPVAPPALERMPRSPEPSSGRLVPPPPVAAAGRSVRNGLPPDAAPPGEPADGTGITRERLEEVLADTNRDLAVLNERLAFRVHEETGQLLVQFVDRESGDVIRSNPPEEFLDLAARLREMVGLFLDERG